VEGAKRRSEENVRGGAGRKCRVRKMRKRGGEGDDSLRSGAGRQEKRREGEDLPFF